MATGWTDEPTSHGVPGHANRGDEAEKIRDAIRAHFGSGYTDWSSSFSVSAVTTPPTKGSSTYNVAYRRPLGQGDVIDFEFYILLDATWAGAPGSGVYRFALPFNASSGSLLRACGTGFIFDAGTANRQTLVRIENVAGVHWLNVFLNGSAGGITNTGSGTAWAANDIIAGSIRYETV